MGRKEKRQYPGIPTAIPSTAHDLTSQFIPLQLVHDTWAEFAHEIRLHPHVTLKFKQRLNEIANKRYS